MIHTFGYYLHIDERALQNLFLLHGVTISNWDNIRAAIKKVNQEIEKNFPGIKINYVNDLVIDGYRVHIKVDVTKLLSKGKVEESDYYTVVLQMEEFIQHSFGSRIGFEHHTLTRIDYKYDAIVSDVKKRELLFHLIDKQTKTYRRKKKIRWSKDENGIPYKYESSQYHKNKSTELIIYDKEKERVANGEPILNYHKNIVRYEIRLHNEHLNSKKNPKKDGHFVPKKLSAYFQESCWKEYMLQHVIPIVHVGTYFKISEAEKIIASSSLTINTKNKLRSFLVQISKGSVDTPKNNMSDATFRKYMRILKELDINPILIPKNRTDFPPSFPNPFRV